MKYSVDNTKDQKRSILFGALAGVAVYFVDTDTIVSTLVFQTVVNVCLTQISFKSGHTNAAEPEIPVSRICGNLQNIKQAMGLLGQVTNNAIFILKISNNELILWD